MSSVDDLLARLTEIDLAIDYANTNYASMPPSVQSLTVRGACIQGLSAFERFLRDRAVEWTAFLTSARVSAGALPGGTEAYSNRIVDTLPRRFKDSAEADRPQLVRDLASTLASFSGPVFVGHDLFFSWTGSNVQTRDVEAIVRLVGVAGGWKELTSFWARVDPRFPGNASAESVMSEFADLRHKAAHDVTAVLDPLSVQSITRNVRLTAMLVDVLVSQSLLHVSKSAAVPAGIGKTVAVRKILRDGSKWPEYSPSGTKAYRRHSSFTVAMTASTVRAKANDEVIVAFDGNDIVDWRTAV